MKNNKGFSLVELIVVIAIMAILAAVAVIGVSVYIPKAQQASDKQLISDIEYALHLAGHDGTFTEGEGGYIILSTEGVLNADEIVSDNPELAEVLKNAFGDNWATDMKLAYDGWKYNGAIVGLQKAQSVADSTYVNELTPNELLGTVKNLTSAAGNILNSQSGSREDMMRFFGPASGGTNAVEQTASDLGIDIESLDETEFANLLVLSAAQDITVNGTTPSAAGNIVTNFALYTSFAETDETFKDAYDDFLVAINQDGVTVDTIAAEYNALKSLVEENGSCHTAFETYYEKQGNTDLEAFQAMMSGLYGASSGNGDLVLDDLGNADMFTTGVGNELFVGYLDSVDAAINVSDDIPTIMGKIAQNPGSVGIIFSRGYDSISIANTAE